jgi:hypothetical protein
MRGTTTSSITVRFQTLFQASGQIAHVLLTRSPLVSITLAGNLLPLDLHA